MAPIDKIILSYHDSCIYQSDHHILKSETSWLNDRIISFYFEYLQREVFENDAILFIGPEVTQGIKMVSDPNEVNAIFLSHLSPESRSYIIFAVNDNSSSDAGGSHWSLCVYSKPDNTFFHFDSYSGSNNSSCSKLVKILKECLGCKSAVIKNVECLQQNNSYDCGIYVLCHTDIVCQAIEKRCEITSIKKLQPKKVQVKRHEVIQIIQNLGGEPL